MSSRTCTLVETWTSLQFLNLQCLRGTVKKNVESFPDIAEIFMKIHYSREINEVINELLF